MSQEPKEQAMFKVIAEHSQVVVEVQTIVGARKLRLWRKATESIHLPNKQPGSVYTDVSHVDWTCWFFPLGKKEVVEALARRVFEFARSGQPQHGETRTQARKRISARMEGLRAQLAVAEAELLLMSRPKAQAA